jgi:hypothetical protein
MIFNNTYGTISSTGITGSLSSSTLITGSSNITISNGSNSVISVGYTSNKYLVLGEEIELNLYDNGQISIAIATLNVLGRPFYEELKKQPISLPSELIEVIEKRLIIIERDSKIDSIVNKE